jgi:ABC-type siderophore export system fused ATPase/permease subunit
MALHLNAETFSSVMDFALVGVSFWMAYSAKQMKMGGAIGKTVNLVVLGAVVLGLAHLIETISTDFLKTPNEINELIHRGIVMVGFILLTVGLRSLGQSLGRLKK